MRKLLTILLLTLTYNCYSQINDTLAFIPASPPAINHKITYDLTGYATNKNLSDTSKVMRTLINAANLQISATNSSLTVTNTRVKQDSGQIVLQGSSILNLGQGQNAQGIRIDSCSKATKTLQNEIDNIVIPPTSGVPKPIIKQGDFTVSDTCHNRDIFMECNLCKLIMPTGLTPGVIFYVHASSGQVNFVYPANGNIESSPSKLSLNGRPVRFIYKKTNQIAGK